MPRATWPPANTAEVLVPEDPYIRPEQRLEEEEEIPQEEAPEEATGEDG